jgi:ATP-dependent DNA helicase RecG
MRPTILFPLFASITSLRGIGPKLAPVFERLCGPHIVDMLFHLPNGVIDRRYRPKLRTADKDRIATLTLRITEHLPPARAGKPYRILATDGSAEITLTYFTAKGDYLSKLYPVDKEIIVSGKLERFAGGWTMSHPDYAVPLSRVAEIPSFEPVYPMTEGASAKILRRVIADSLSRLPDLPEWHDEALLKRENWPAWKDALHQVHNPTKPEGDLDAQPARRRLAYDELLADQLALAIIRRHAKKAAGRAFAGTGKLTEALKKNLPFTLTAGQIEALREITEDLAAPERMLRLLQGDVGSGKTIVALFAMLQLVESGSQAALLAPTEILAKQHYDRLKEFLEPLNIPVGLLTGKKNASARKQTLAALEDGSLQIVVGTHALFQEEIIFKDLGLAVIDEQHRFGVQQRLLLSDKGKGVDILLMTATPIPRTLTLTAYGDMDVSRLADKPAGRQPIDTRLIDLERLDEVVAGVGRQIAKGAKVYWVCPLVEESEKSDLAAATARAETLRSHFGAEAVGLVHGRMKGDEKNRVMESFAHGDTKILVATTVIEVGVDVPEACLMIVEHAERFGLAALHQLRGRVGRGAAKSTCLFLFQAPLSETAKARLTCLRETEDGFLIAEEDLRLRGPGEVLGTRQSGAPLYKMASLYGDRDLIAIASADSKHILAQDPELSTPRGKALRTLLYLFEKDSAVRLFRAG